MKEKVVRSAWLERQGRRLDCGPYTSGAIEAKERLRALPVRRAELRAVTRGHAGGIYNGPQFVRNYVSDQRYGVPFVTSGSMLHAEFSNIALLRKSDAQSSALAYLRLEEGMTLISCSGTIGRMAYARREMAGMWSSQDVMKIVPDPKVVHPGYLYAFLSSRFGVPLVTGSKYGAIVQHIEPKHLTGLPVPLAPAALQKEVHRRVTEAAELRTEASVALRAVIRDIEDAAGLPPFERQIPRSGLDTTLAEASALGARMDGMFHSNYHRSALDPLFRLPKERRTTVRHVAERLFHPDRFKGIRVDDPLYGHRFFKTAALIRAEPDIGYYVAKRILGVDKLLVNELAVLIPASGQINGIIGHPVLPYGDVVGGAVSQDAIRIFCTSKAICGYLFAFLSSEYGRRQLKSRTFGSSIPHLSVSGVEEVVVPKLKHGDIETLGHRAFAVRTARHEAIIKEREARSVLEHWIEEQGAA